MQKAEFIYDDWLEDNDLPALDIDDEVAKALAKALSGRQLKQRRDAARKRKRKAAIAVGAGAAGVAVLAAGAGARYQGHVRRGVKLGGALHDVGMAGDISRRKAQAMGGAKGVQVGVKDDVRRVKSGTKRAVSSVTGLRRRSNPSPAGTNTAVDVTSREAPIFGAANTGLSTGRKRNSGAVGRARSAKALNAGPRAHGRGGAPGRKRPHGQGEGPRHHPIVVGPEGVRQSPVPKRKKIPHFHPSSPVARSKRKSPKA